MFGLFDPSHYIALFGSIGTPEVLIVLGVMALLFGSAKLPQLMRNMGRSVNEFKAGMKDKPNIEDKGRDDKNRIENDDRDD